MYIRRRRGRIRPKTFPLVIGRRNEGRYGVGRRSSQLSRWMTCHRATLLQPCNRCNCRMVFVCGKHARVCGICIRMFANELVGNNFYYKCVPTTRRAIIYWCITLSMLTRSPSFLKVTRAHWSRTIDRLYCVCIYIYDYTNGIIFHRSTRNLHRLAVRRGLN